MDSQNIHGIILQLKSITESIDKIAEGVNNSWRVWISLAGILVALLLGVIGIFQEKIRTWILKPKLRVVIENYKIPDMDYGGIPCYNFIIKIKNGGKSTLEDAEALISDIWQMNGNREEKINFMPFNLTWKGHGATIPKIPIHTYKYFDFGNILRPDTQLPEGSFVIFRPPSSIEFKTVNEEINLKSPGKYKIKIIFSGNNIKPQIKIYKFDIKNEWADDVYNIKKMLLIEEED